ncbi:MAG: serine hydrolase [Planctomycetota bacterium]|nr:serine hydrolase [Planctomycetota bacterium]
MPRLSPILVILLAFNLSTDNLFAEDRSPETASSKTPVSEILEAIRVEYKLPALAAGIVTSNGVQEMAAVGNRKMGDDTKVTETDLWHLGSCTKAMTATMIGILVHEGKLAWDTTLAEIFPEDAKLMDDAFRKITLMHLLTHRSGLPANSAWWSLGKDRSLPEQRHELLRRMIKVSVSDEPGTKFLYSNVGYALAGLIAETKMGMSWESLMREKLFQPLEMKQVGFGIPGTPGEVDQPWGHQPTWLGLGALKPVQLDNAPSIGPAGTVHASIEDWGKFIALHLKPENSLMPKEIWTQLHTPPVDAEYALGWGVVERPWAGGQAWTHSGSNTVNYCVCWLAPKKDFAVIVTTNSGQQTAALALDKAASELIRRKLK